MKKYKLLSANPDLNEALDWIRQATREREFDLENYNNQTTTNVTFYSYIPSSSSDLIGTEKPGDIAADTTTLYVVVDNAGTLEWQSISIGGGAAMALLDTQTASASAAINFDSSIITSSYKKYIFEFIDVYSTGNDVLIALFSKDNGSNILGSGYRYDLNNLSGNANAITRSASAAVMALSVETAPTAAQAISGSVSLNNPLGTTNTKKLHGLLSYTTASDVLGVVTAVAGYTTDADAINYVRFAMNTGTITGGIIKCYGVN